MWRVRSEPMGYTDAELVLAARGGDVEALTEILSRYRRLALAKVASYFLVGADREDIIQEAMIGLYKAVRDFDQTSGASFHHFADVCVTRQVLTAIKAATRQKHAPLNGYVSFDGPAENDGSELRLVDRLASRTSPDPADLVVSAERIRNLQVYVDSVLSDFEVDVLRLYLDGLAYDEIADKVGRHAKAVDNALQRVKRKIGIHLRERELAEAG